MNSQVTHPILYELSRPFPRRLIRQKPGSSGGNYVPHYVVTQALLAIVGPFDWELVQILRGDSSGITKGELVEAANVIVGAVYRLTANVDTGVVRVEEVGSVENAYQVRDDGERLKRASSDALKRAAMRLGLGVQLWCKTPDELFLSRVLADDESAVPVSDADDHPVGGEDDERTYGDDDPERPF